MRRCDGLSRRAGDPQLLDIRAELRAPGRHVRAELFVELARAPVRSLGMVGDVRELGRSDCELPNVSWIVPNAKVSEHPQALVSHGLGVHVTTLINSIMRSPCWTAPRRFSPGTIGVGLDDNVVPPDIDENGYGFRVPGLANQFDSMAVRIPVRTYVKKPRGLGNLESDFDLTRCRGHR